MLEFARWASSDPWWTNSPPRSSGGGGGACWGRYGPRRAGGRRRRGGALVQVLVGPRQVGKTTAAAQIERRLGWPCVTASADAAIPHPPEWIQTQWRPGGHARAGGGGGGVA